MMKTNIVVLPGDGIGPEVTSATVQIISIIGKRFNHQFSFQEHLLGGCAIDATGTALPQSTLSACKAADAILLGAVGGPKWDDPTASVRPEQGLLGLRKALGLYANLRPVRPHPKLNPASPLRQELLQGVDLLVLRELTGGVYFGQPSERRTVNGEQVALDTMIYSVSEISRIAHLAFATARQRRKLVTSVDKANVLESSRLWRQTVAEVAHEYPDVELENLLVDAATMHLLTRPSSFDVLVTTNLFGDILTDEASVLAGSMGNLPSASLGESMNQHRFPRGLYEPIHGSAPDIAGKGVANPIGAILSAAMMLRHSFGLEEEAHLVEDTIEQVINEGYRTRDLAREGDRLLGTLELTKLISNRLQS